ncbi:bifunctional 5,10-methylenetetrahydrofolate dehydrogenase/5,10-methenyltetrahydrofolate cyclohydrolase [bacterium]|nr:bifunctional 5,10-methylenetetrahydrofolate dehydrogenase/5,10-methenyltetrahydrofolate cyclohydrolase [bacterium]
MDIRGSVIAQKILDDVKKEITQSKFSPSLIFFYIEDHAPSKIYVGMKVRACEKVGIHSIKVSLPSSITEKELLKKIEEANNDPAIHAILVQMPLPKQINTSHIIHAIDPKKDVDGFHPLNLGKLIRGEKDTLTPCTPLGICTLLEAEGIETAGKDIAIVGRSMIVGTPLANMLATKGRDGTVTLLHSKSKNLTKALLRADIIIAAIGSPNFITKEMVKEGAVCIDVGISRVDGKLVGDIDYENVKKVASKITPVPGGVGPMTIACLMQNTLLCYKKM